MVGWSRRSSESKARKEEFDRYWQSLSLEEKREWFIKEELNDARQDKILAIVAFSLGILLVVVQLLRLAY